MKVRIYGKELERWMSEAKHGWLVMSQVELAYKDYDSITGEAVQTGSEDFSAERYHSAVSRKSVWTWDGERRNKGGHRWFELQPDIKFRKSDRKGVMEYLKIKYPDAVEIQLR